MKKLFTLLVALTTIVCGLNAEVLLKDSFARNVGNLNAGDYQNMGTDLTNWWYTSSSTTTKVQVIDTNLTKAGYQANPSGRAIQFKGNAQKDVRAFNRFAAVAGKSIYYSVLLNVKALKSNSTSRENLITLTDASITAGYCYAELRFLNNYDDNTYQLGVTKANENGVRWSKPLPLDSTILAVIRYDFIEGDTNDVAYLWINPTKLDESVPTSLHSVQDTASSQGAKWGANQKVDPSGLKWVYLKPTTNTVNIILDEIRVATKWADLFEGGGGNEPAIGVNTSLSFGDLYQGTEMSKDLSINAENLKGDITVTHKHADITLSDATITKADAEAGATLKVSLKANTAGAQVDTIILSSTDVEKKVIVSWNSYPVVACANIAALKDSAKLYEAYAGLFRLTGEAIVTRDTTISDREIYLQDATGAVKLFDSYGYCGANLVGAKATNFILNNGEEALGILPFIILQAPTIVSTGNTVEPQEVTLAALQANATDYLYELVKIKGVTFTDAGGSFAVGQYDISQATENANIKVENNNIVSKTIPAKANVIGFCFNTSGSVILPRNIDDIIDANPELLKNGSFEKWKVSSAGMFGKTTEFNEWTIASMAGSARVVDSTDVLDGKYAFKTTSDLNVGGAYISQEIDCKEYAQNDEFKVRIGYKNLNDSILTLDCYWETSKGSAEGMKQGAVQQVLASSKSEYNVVNVKTNKPESANYFVFKVKIPKKALVLIDDCAFTYIDPTTTAVEEMPAMEIKARKVICNGQLLIVRDGIFYSITGQKL